MGSNTTRSRDLDPTQLSVPAAPQPRNAEPVATSDAGDSELPDPSLTQVKIMRGEGELAPGMMVGDYRIEAKIGEGGMGLVYAAVHPLIGKRAAIKVLRKELCTDPGAIERFIDEARVVNKIGHANLIDIFTFGQVPDGRHYLVMEWLKGETLRIRLTRGRLSFDEIRGVLRPLARALAAAHDAGVIHRDLKPDNVFLVDVRDDAPQVKLLDFGLAKLANTEHRMEQTASGAMLGTPLYIAPEQARGQNVDHRADIYALGALAFELLTGRPPFIGVNTMEVVAKHLMEEPVRPSSLVAGIPNELDDLVVSMLAKDPSLRPTLAAFQRALDPGRAVTPQPYMEPAAPQPHLELAAPQPHRQPTTPQPHRQTAAPQPHLQPAAPGPHLQPAAPQPNPQSAARAGVSKPWLFAGVIVAVAVVLGVVIATSGGSMRVATTESTSPVAPAAVSPPQDPVVAPAPAAEPAPAATIERAPAATIERAPAATIEPEPAASIEPTAKPDLPTKSRPKPTSRPRPAQAKPAPPPPPPPAPPDESITELNEQATQLFVRGKFAAAEAAFKKVLAADRTYAPAYHGLGLLYQRTGENQKAIEAFRTYLKLSPNAKNAAKIRSRIEELGG